MNMREKMARALDKWRIDERPTGPGDSEPADLNEVIDAVLDAMREPNQEIKYSGCVKLEGWPPWDDRCSKGWTLGPDGADKTWKSMIDAIKAGK